MNAYRYRTSTRSRPDARHACWLACLAARRFNILFVTNWFSGVEDQPCFKPSLGAARYTVAGRSQARPVVNRTTQPDLLLQPVAVSTAACSTLRNLDGAGFCQLAAGRWGYSR
jgi:hypothetical protein